MPFQKETSANTSDMKGHAGVAYTFAVRYLTALPNPIISTVRNISDLGCYASMI